MRLPHRRCHQGARGPRGHGQEADRFFSGEGLDAVKAKAGAGWNHRFKHSTSSIAGKSLTVVTL
jgi:hypothetical protein